MLPSNRDFCGNGTQVPVFEGQRVVQTLIDLHVEERRGGYQDRSGKKNERYLLPRVTHPVTPVNVGVLRASPS